MVVTVTGQVTVRVAGGSSHRQSHTNDVGDTRNEVGWCCHPRDTASKMGLGLSWQWWELPVTIKVGDRQEMDKDNRPLGSLPLVPALLETPGEMKQGSGHPSTDSQNDLGDQGRLMEVAVGRRSLEFSLSSGGC